MLDVLFSIWCLTMVFCSVVFEVVAVMLFRCFSCCSLQFHGHLLLLLLLTAYSHT